MPYEYEQNFDATVVQYFCGRLPESARLAFEEWLREDPSRVDRIERLRVLWELSAEAPEVEPEVEAALARVRHQIWDRQRSVTERRPVLKLQPSLGGAPRWWRARGWRAAAAILAVVGIGLLWRLTQSPPPPTMQAAATRSYATARGERAVVSLPDGSTVTLHNESRLEVPLDFGRAARDVRLVGEGYFEVEPDPSRPFRVYAAGSVTQVLGTQFGVRARRGDRVVQVAVAEGRVAARRGGDSPAPVLTAGQVARFQEDGKVALQDGVDVRRLLSWTGGRLVFDGTPLPDVLAELNRWFDREFVLGDSTLAGLRLTTVLGGQSLAETITVLETALDARALTAGRRIILIRR